SWWFRCIVIYSSPYLFSKNRFRREDCTPYRITTAEARAYELGLQRKLNFYCTKALLSCLLLLIIPFPTSLSTKFPFLGPMAPRVSGSFLVLSQRRSRDLSAIMAQA